jgi:hypothetical protein
MPTDNKEELPVPSQAELLYDHQDIARSIRRISEYMIKRFAANIDSDAKFLELIPKFDRASLTLQRLNSIICNILPMEQKILEARIELLPPPSSQLTNEDFAMVISTAKQFGLLKEGAEDKIEDLIDEFNQRKQVNIAHDTNKEGDTHE